MSFIGPSPRRRPPRSFVPVLLGDVNYETIGHVNLKDRSERTQSLKRRGRVADGDPGGRRCGFEREMTGRPPPFGQRERNSYLANAWQEGVFARTVVRGFRTLFPRSPLRDPGGRRAMSLRPPDVVQPVRRTSFRLRP